MFQYSGLTHRPFLFRAIAAVEGMTLVRMAATAEPRDSPEARLVNVTRIEPTSFYSNQQLCFSLLAAPTRCLTARRRGERSRILPICHKEQQLVWLRSRLGNAAEPLSAAVADAATVRFTKRGVPGSFLQVEFHGRLAVRDVDEFMRMLKAGIGRQKAFGLGLLDVFSGYPAPDRPTGLGTGVPALTPGLCIGAPNRAVFTRGYRARARTRELH